MTSAERSKRLHMLLSDGEETMLRALADDEGLSVSDLVRQLIRRAFMEKWPPRLSKLKR